MLCLLSLHKNLYTRIHEFLGLSSFLSDCKQHGSGPCLKYVCLYGHVCSAKCLHVTGERHVGGGGDVQAVLCLMLVCPMISSLVGYF